MAKNDHPKILLVDLETKVEEHLRVKGYNISGGSFGTPYQVNKSSNYAPVVVKASLPEYAEQEIIVVDLAQTQPTVLKPAEKLTPNEELDWWAKCNHGLVDPRPRVMDHVRDDSDRILSNGGVFIVFADAEIHQELVTGTLTEGYYGGFSISEQLDANNWSFLSVLRGLSVISDSGREITIVQDGTPWPRILGPYLSDATFSCTIDPRYHNDKWIALAENKYGKAVAGALAVSGGWVFIFPRVKDKGTLLSTLLSDVLPELCPTLFPDYEGQKWVHRPEYELPSVLAKVSQITSIHEIAESQIAELNAQIEAERANADHLYELLRATGTPLVVAVKHVLAELGFLEVIDVDEEMRAAGKDGSLREDLRILDRSPILVVDVKGVSGTPADSEALQAQKHTLVNIREMNRTDVEGLTIINHQRHLPPLDRENDMPYRQEIIDNAEQTNLGLMTTWDLFRLVRGFAQNNWRPAHVQPVFYRTGRIQPIPQHYHFLGRVKQVWKNAFSIVIEHEGLAVGDRIGIELPVDFDEQVIASLQQDAAAVDTAKVGEEIGVARDESAPKLKRGMPVYRIKND